MHREAKTQGNQEEEVEDSDEDKEDTEKPPWEQRGTETQETPPRRSVAWNGKTWQTLEPEVHSTWRKRDRADSEEREGCKGSRRNSVNLGDDETRDHLERQGRK